MPTRPPNHRLRRGLVAALAIAVLAFLVSLVAERVLSARFADQLAQVSRETADRRADFISQKNGVVASAVEALNARKAASASSVMTLEALSRILPDDVYLTQMQIEDGKVRISGLARDAASLIGLMEQSGRFTHVTFYAPTVRNSSSGDTFHLEGHIEPPFVVSN